MITLRESGYFSLEHVSLIFFCLQEVSAPGSHDHHTQKVVTSSFNMLSPLGEPELRQLWRRGFIYGFISRAGAEKLLQPSKVPLGTFLVRFSGE